MATLCTMLATRGFNAEGRAACALQSQKKLGYVYTAHIQPYFSW